MAQETYFPTITDADVRSESTVEITVKSLSKPGAPFVVTLDGRRTMSRVMDGLGFSLEAATGNGDRNKKDTNEELAAHFSNIYGVEVTRQDVAIARLLAKVWRGPTREDGQLPLLDDLVKLSIVDGFALVEIWTSWLGVARDAIDSLVSEAKENFPSPTPSNSSSS